MRVWRRTLSLLPVLLYCAACDAETRPEPDTKPVVLGGVTVSAWELARGEKVYRQYCRPCHGESGDGKGPQGRHLTPPPRDLRTGEYRHAPDQNALPDDAYFHKILAEGIPNTMMQPWGLERDDRHAVIQYVKSLSPRWHTR